MIVEMTHLFKRLMSILLFVTLLVCTPMTISTASQNKTYIIDEIAIDVTAENAVQARENAILEAQRSAFDKLVKNTLNDADYQSLPTISDQMLTDLVRGFSVKNERSSADRYKAEFTVTFDEEKLERFLGVVGLADFHKGHSSIVIMPFLQIGSKLILWDEPNPWREAWQKNVILNTDNLTIRVPIGDISDIADIPDASAFTPDSANITTILERYNAQHVIYAVAKTKGPVLDPSEGVRVTLYSVSPNSVTRLNQIAVTHDLEKLSFENAITETVDYLEKNWSSQITFSEIQSQSVTAQLYMSGLAEWVDIKRQIESLANVENVKNNSMTHDRVDLTIEYTGSLDDFRNVLNLNGFNLSRNSLGISEYLLTKKTEMNSYLQEY